MPTIEEVRAAVDHLSAHHPETFTTPDLVGVSPAAATAYADAKAKTLGWLGSVLPVVAHDLGVVFKDAEKAWNYKGIGDWMLTPNPAMGNEIPIQFILETAQDIIPFNPIALAQKVGPVILKIAQDQVAAHKANPHLGAMGSPTGTQFGAPDPKTYKPHVAPPQGGDLTGH